MVYGITPPGHRLVLSRMGAEPSTPVTPTFLLGIFISTCHRRPSWYFAANKAKEALIYSSLQGDSCLTLLLYWGDKTYLYSPPSMERFCGLGSPQINEQILKQSLDKNHHWEKNVQVVLPYDWKKIQGSKGQEVFRRGRRVNFHPDLLLSRKKKPILTSPSYLIHTCCIPRPFASCKFTLIKQKQTKKTKTLNQP